MNTLCQQFCPELLSARRAELEAAMSNLSLGKTYREDGEKYNSKSGTRSTAVQDNTSKEEDSKEEGEEEGEVNG
jgi:hypothetical protein